MVCVGCYINQAVIDLLSDESQLTYCHPFHDQDSQWGGLDSESPKSSVLIANPILPADHN